MLALGLVLPILLAATAEASEYKDIIKNWLVYYSDQADPKVIARFDLVALDPDAHPPLLRRSPKTPLYLGYISLGEAEPHRSFYHLVKGRQDAGGA
jgi:hypothetical protein